MFKGIWSSLATVSGSLVVDGSEALVSRTSEKEISKKRSRDESPTRPSVFSINLIQDLVSNSDSGRITEICQVTQGSSVQNNNDKLIMI